MKFFKFIALFCLSSIYISCNAEIFYITTPKTLRLNSEELAFIAVEHENGAIVNIYVQDYPGKIKNITSTTFQVHKGTPEPFTINLNPGKFPPNFLTSPSVEKFVTLIVHSEDFHQEIKIPISHDVGYVFIQTDKPIYSPSKRVHFRIISLNEDALPSSEPFVLQIKNPQNIIVEEKTFNNQATTRLGSDKEFVSYQYSIPKYAVVGEWSATVKYGYKLQQNTTVEFKVEEYILPTFTLELKTPNFILDTDEFIPVTVNAKYVFGKKVDGSATVQIGIQGETSEGHYFAKYGPNELDNGAYKLNIDTQDFSHHRNVGWFPEIEGKKLVIKATVTDAATGKKQTIVDSRSRFAKSPYSISFKRSVQDFKPGLVTVIEADISFVDGRPASGIPTILEATSNGRPLKVSNISPTSNDQGRVLYELNTEIMYNTIQITLKTNDEKYADNQAVGSFIQQKFVSKNEAYIAIDKSNIKKSKINDYFRRGIHFEPADIQNATYFTVSSKGKIILQGILEDKVKVKRVEFQITYKMVPSFRITVFTQYKDELLIDSMNVDIEDTCTPNEKVSIELENNILEPGTIAKININGLPSSLVGLLGVDEAVYALSNKDILTETKVLKALAKHDLGCGAGGGLTTDIVMANAGLLITTNYHTPSLAASSCAIINRRKRSVLRDILKNYIGFAKQCCYLGISYDVYRRSCEARTNIVHEYLDGDHDECTVAFLECCIKAEDVGIIEMKLGRNGVKAVIGDEPILLTEDEENDREKAATVRQDFRETWYEDLFLGADGKKLFRVSLPHSITTWVIQAVSVSKLHGICVAKHKEIVSFKKVFLQLNFPYSVIRNEQVELQVTVFNYADQDLSVTIFMYGVEGLCTGAHKGERSERKSLVVNRDSTATVTFPIIPLQEGQFTLRVVAVSSGGSDVIIQTLNVVPEGTTKEIHVPIKLDPTNQQRRKKRFINNDEIPGVRVKDSIDTFRKVQQTVITLSVPHDLVPGTESCNIVALGDQLGPAIETAVKDPGNLISLPTGCAEQNMVRLAPTIYAMRYLKIAGKITPDLEEQGYNFMRSGYGNVLAYRIEDGSYSAWNGRPASTWLTAFVMKVFCQANELIHIDDMVISSGLKWLINNQEPDGSFLEHNPMHHADMVGGVQGKTPLTAYVLIAFEECQNNVEDISISKARAISYLEQHLGDGDKPLPAAVIAYALTLTDSAMKQAALDNLMTLVQYDEDANSMHWGIDNSAKDIEATSYALLTQILFNDFGRGNAIVNWLNSQQLQTGSFHSTQDTVIALQALSEYAIKAKRPSINLVANVSSDNERNLHQSFVFDERNAHIMQETKKNIKTDGSLIIITSGYGIGQLIVKLKYNVFPSKDKKCIFNVTVNATEINEEDNLLRSRKGSGQKNRRANIVDGIQKALNPDEAELEKSQEEDDQQIVVGKNGPQRNDEFFKPLWKFVVCAKYLENKNPEMTIVDVGLFSGFEPDEDDLRELQRDPDHYIDKYEKYNNGIQFYLRTVPTKEFYCFDFYATQEFNIRNTQISKVQVYDYYSHPDVVCTVFYASDDKSPLLHTLCNGRVCQCAEGGCPSKNTLYVGKWEETTVDQKTEDFRTLACNEYDFVWIGKVNGEIIQKNGYYNISFKIEEVIKEGAEKSSVLGLTRSFLARDNCGEAYMFPNQLYLVMGKDGQAFIDDEGNTWYRYLLDKKSVVHLWTSIKDAKDRNLQKPLKRAMEKLKKEGCGD